jgi:pathogenesis-related protein 1
MTDDKSLKEDARQCAIMKLPTDRTYQLRSTDLRGMNQSTCNTMQGKSGQATEVCGGLATPPKLSHILLLRAVAMRLPLALVALAVSGSAQAQYPYSYAPYIPRDLPSSGQYAAPIQGRSSTSISQALLDANNVVRARVGVPPLVWSDELAKVAQDWGNHLIATGALSHRPNNGYGENIYTLSGAAASPAQVVNYWAAEARSYDIRSNTCKGVCGHYTQVIWGKTRAVGCAVATDRRREVWVCNYDPPGNVIGYRSY